MRSAADSRQPCPQRILLIFHARGIMHTASRRAYEISQCTCARATPPTHAVHARVLRTGADLMLSRCAREACCWLRTSAHAPAFITARRESVKTCCQEHTSRAGAIARQRRQPAATANSHRDPTTRAHAKKTRPKSLNKNPPRRSHLLTQAHFSIQQFHNPLPYSSRLRYGPTVKKILHMRILHTHPHTPGIRYGHQSNVSQTRVQAHERHALCAASAAGRAYATTLAAIAASRGSRA